MNRFEAGNIFAAYGNAQVLCGLSFTVENGEIAGILGANGSGKTTLLKCICGILPHEGRCTLDGEALEALSPRNIARLCSYIPQRSGIGIDISVLDVVLMGFNPRLGLLERPDAQMRQAALEALALVGLEERAHANYLALSEGQKQLCMLARTLISDSRLLLLDEPESALDFRHRHRILKLIRSWVADAPRCAIISLHDPQLALRHCDRLILLNEGKVLAELRPQADALDDMEAALRCLYGSVILERIEDRTGQKHLLMLNEGDERI